MKRLLAVVVLLLLATAATAQDQPASAPVQPPPPSAAPAQPSAGDTAETPRPVPWAGYPAREVDRPILVKANSYQMSIWLQSFSAQDTFNDEGQRESINRPIDIFSLDIGLRYGIYDRWEIYAGLPYSTAQTSDFSSGAVGNIYAGTRVALIASDAFQLAAGLSISAPTGDAEYHYYLVHGDVVPENFRTGNPGVDWLPEVQLRYRATDNVNLRLRLQGIFSGPGETVLNQIGGKDLKRDIDPGDGLRLDLLAVTQLSNRWVLPLGISYYQIGETELKDMNFHDEQMLLDARLGVMAQISPDFDVEVWGRVPLTGQNAYLATPVGLELRTRF